MKNQIVGQQQVVVGFQARRGLPGFTDECGGFDIKIRNRLPLQAESRPGLWRARFEVLACPSDYVPR
ncbi:hypothetical protein Pgy4_11187 [Pseudomonas savastanoi pv. glycinea str. race 4]|uniref:Uncharacterized protein n=1 Tax=Pseudomonas savastanoi pv. glycinea str. race 4 TaxID=875330 RepID=F3C3R8_PSESG|nr:hypothetical protein Pgy4_11187 [Pseudomonas savastanoi pv. glycinea str. race 4]